MPFGLLPVRKKSVLDQIGNAPCTYAPSQASGNVIDPLAGPTPARRKKRKMRTAKSRNGILPEGTPARKRDIPGGKSGPVLKTHLEKTKALTADISKNAGCRKTTPEVCKSALYIRAVSSAV